MRTITNKSKTPAEVDVSLKEPTPQVPVKTRAYLMQIDMHALRCYEQSASVLLLPFPFLVSILLESACPLLVRMAPEVVNCVQNIYFLSDFEVSALTPIV